MLKKKEKTMKIVQKKFFLKYFNSYLLFMLVVVSFSGLCAFSNITSMEWKGIKRRYKRTKISRICS